MVNYLLAWTDGNRQYSREFEDYNSAVNYYDVLCRNPIYDVKFPVALRE